MPHVHLYYQTDIGALDWPATADGAYARRYLLPFLQAGPSVYIANVQTQMAVLRVDDALLPITVTDYRPGNSYVCSPYNQYIDYAQEELGKLGNRAAESAVRALLWPLAKLFQRRHFDKVVMVNNWLLSTNLYPALTTDQIHAVSRFLPLYFPEHAILFRSVDPHGNSMLYDTLQAQDYAMIFSRQIYYMDGREPQVISKKQFKIDLGKYRKSEYTLVDGVDLQPSDLARIRDLYTALYLDKYSYHNPQFTDRFYQLALDQQLLTIKAFRKAGQIDAVLGYFARTNSSGTPVMTQPLFGYATNLPPALGLYRLLSTQTALEGIQHQRLIHCSAGVGEFKRLRGAVPTIEYNAAYYRHLPKTRQTPWHILKALLDRLAIPVIQKYGF